jgi:hypothetical protein
VLEQIHHLAKVRGLTHLVLEVAENNDRALQWYRKRGFRKLDAAIFMAHSVDAEPELLPPRPLVQTSPPSPGGLAIEVSSGNGANGESPAASSRRRRARRKTRPPKSDAP